MLTYRFITLSKPVSPIVSLGCECKVSIICRSGAILFCPLRFACSSTTDRLRAEKFVFAVRKNMARELFRFGSGAEKFTRQSEKNLAPFSQKTRATIGAFLVRVSEIAGYRGSRSGDRWLHTHSWDSALQSIRSWRACCSPQCGA